MGSSAFLAMTAPHTSPAVGLSGSRSSVNAAELRVMRSSIQCHPAWRMVQQESAGNPVTGRPYPVADIRGISRSITYGALVEPAL